MLRIFLTGLLAALPLVATLLIFLWGAELLYGWLGPHSRVGRLLVSIGFGGAGSEVVGYLIGVLVVVALIFGLGLLVRSRLRGFVGDSVDALMRRIPVVRSVYDVVRRFVGLVSERDENGLRSMSPVWVHFGGVGGAAALALLSTPEPVPIDGRPYFAVLVPTAPVPIGGGLLYVPVDWVTRAEVGIEGLTSIYVSMGVTSHQHLAATPPGIVVAR
jgi:uncharacterized membrane protein